MSEEFAPCDGCKQPESCGGRWPDDDPHMPGRLRGCFAAKTGSFQITTCAGKTLKPESNGMAPPTFEAITPTEKRPGGFEVPYIKGSGGHMKMKEFISRRSDIEQVRDAQRNGQVKMASLKETSHTRNPSAGIPGT